MSKPNGNTTHGGSRRPEYQVWITMRSRCNKPSAPAYEHYGGRGIKVCAQWANFGRFIADMGSRPEGMTIERIDNDGNYEPGNCRWATRAEQARNRRSTHNVTHGGRTMCLKDWAREIGMHYTTLLHRQRRGLSPAAVLDRGSRPQRSKGHE